MSTLKAQGTKAFLWDFFGKFANHSVSFIITIFLARLLEPADFGLIAIVMVIIGITSLLSDFGLGSAIIQRRKIHEIHYHSIFYFNIFLGLILTIIVYLLAPFIAEYYLNDKLIKIIRILSILFVVNALGSVQIIQLRKALNLSLLAKINLLSVLISGFVGVFLAYKGYGVWSMVIQIVMMTILYNLLIFFIVRWKPKLKFSLKALMQLWRFGFHVFLAHGLDVITTRIDFMIIGKLFNATTLGYYQRAKSLNNLFIEYSSSSLLAVLFPLLSNIQKNLEEFKNLFRSVYVLILFIVFFLAGNLYILADDIIVFLFSDKWLPSVDYFKLLILGAFSYPISALLVNVIMSRGKSKDFLIMTLLKKTFFILNLYVGFLFGIKGYLIGLIIVHFFGILINFMYVSKELSITISSMMLPLLQQIVIAFVMVIVTLYTIQFFELDGIIGFILKLSMYTSLYVWTNYLLKTEAYENFIQQIKNFNKRRKSKNDI